MSVRWALVCLVLGLALTGAVHAADSLRDPFVFGPRGDSRPEGGGPLIGILWDATNPLAIVGEETVAVGDRIAGWQIVAIEDDGVIVERGGHREKIGLGRQVPPE